MIRPHPATTNRPGADIVQQAINVEGTGRSPHTTSTDRLSGHDLMVWDLAYCMKGMWCNNKGKSDTTAMSGNERNTCFVDHFEKTKQLANTFRGQRMKALRSRRP